MMTDTGEQTTANVGPAATLIRTVNRMPLITEKNEQVHGHPNNTYNKTEEYRRGGETRNHRCLCDEKTILYIKHIQIKRKVKNPTLGSNT